MKSKQSKKNLEQLLSQESNSELPQNFIALMLKFYQSHPASDCLEQDSDLLLYQWGTYDWFDGKGEWFQLSITRQFIPQSPSLAKVLPFLKRDDDDIFQLSITAKYQPTEETSQLQSGSHWHDPTKEVSSFKALIEQSSAYQLFSSKQPELFELDYENAG